MNDLEKKLAQIEQEKRQILENYQKQRHLDLLARSDELKKLSIVESKERKELLSYSNLLFDQVNWETQDQFLQLLEKFLNDEIWVGTFRTEFFERYELNDDTATVLESNFVLLSPHKKSFDFSQLILQLLDACYSYDPNGEAEDSFEKEVERLTESAQTIYLEIQKLLEE